MNAFAGDQAIESALANEDVGSLSNFLAQRGYTAELDQAAVTTINETTLSSEQAISLDVDVTLIPFTSRTEGSARIAAWSGYVDADYSDGAIATIGEQDIYLVVDGQVQAVASDELARYLDTPLHVMPGPAPRGALEGGVVENDGDIQINGSCKTVNAWRNSYTLLGFLAYSFHQRKRFCYNGSSVYSITVDAYVSNMDSQHYYRGVVSSWNNYISGSWGHDSMRQGQIDNCILKYGCIGSYYPTVRIKTYGNGNWSYSTWD